MPKGQASVEFKMDRRGQAAIEYLMNYAWAIALIIIVGVAIFSLNLGDIGFSLSSSGSGLSQQFEQVAVTGYKWGVTPSTDINDTFILTLQNNGANKITVNRVNVTEIDKSAVIVITHNTTSTSLFPGETVTRTINISTSGLGITKKAGDQFTVKVAVNYTDDETAVVYNSARTLKGKAQLD